MKKAIILFIGLLVIGCSNDDPLRLEQRGYLSVETKLTDFTTSKADVPECTSEIPNNIKVRLVNMEGSAFTVTSAITITDNNIIPTEQMEFPIGNYTVDEISLFTDANILTHTAPNELDNRFDFTVYAANPLPYDVIITTDAITTIQSQLMCYTEEDVINAPIYDWYSRIVDLQTYAFNLPESSCVDKITLQVVTPEINKILEIPLYKRGLYRIPIPVDFTYINLRFYVNDVVMESFAMNSYNDDGILDANDVIQVPDKCF